MPSATMRAFGTRITVVRHDGLVNGTPVALRVAHRTFEFAGRAGVSIFELPTARCGVRR